MKPYILSLLFLLTINSLSAQVDLSSLNNPIELINKASINYEKGNFSQAISQLKAAIKLDSSKRDAFTILNRVLYKTGDKKLQIEYLKKAKSIYSDDDEFPYQLGKIYQKENKLKAAIAEYDTAIKFSKVNGEDYEIVYDYYANRGICFLKQNLFARSIVDFDYAIKLNDMKGSIYTNRGIALFQMKKKEEACKSWEKALELGQNVEQYLTKYCK
jgi:tetratricopeptide (TPR) repeat protein